MNRVTPERVKAAYEKLPYKPVQGEFMSPDLLGCCGLTAVSRAEFGQPTVFPNISNLGQCLGTTLAYAYGYTYGFDSLPRAAAEEGVFALIDEGRLPDTDEAREHFWLGYEDGAASWEAVKEAA